ncbi:MAG: DUF1365 domain-containing protein [Vicinamibacterales bacterium]
MTPRLRPGVYTGWLRHRRTEPVAHTFSYPLFMVLLDIDRIPELMSASRFTSHNRWNWASFHDVDHTGDPSLSLRERLTRDAAAHGQVLPDGPVLLLTNLRYLGYCFNPVSFYYCHDAGGQLRLILAEVHNTFGGSHNYWLTPEGVGLPSTETPATPMFRASAMKSFYVSPFMPAEMQYRFAFSQPGSTLVAHMALEQDGAPPSRHSFDATLSLQFRPWSHTEISRALFRHPAMTLKVVAGIHWEALKLWSKGLSVVPRPTPDGVFPDRAAPEPGPAMSRP